MATYFSVSPGGIRHEFPPAGYGGAAIKLCDHSSASYTVHGSRRNLFFLLPPVNNGTKIIRLTRRCHRRLY